MYLNIPNDVVKASRPSLKQDKLIKTVTGHVFEYSKWCCQIFPTLSETRQTDLDSNRPCTWIFQMMLLKLPSPLWNRTHWVRLWQAMYLNIPNDVVKAARPSLKQANLSKTVTGHVFEYSKWCHQSCSTLSEMRQTELDCNRPCIWIFQMMLSKLPHPLWNKTNWVRL